MAGRLPPLPRGSLALVLNAVLALVALGLAFAPPGEGAPNLQLASASGALALSNSKEGRAIFHADAMRPGQEVSGSVTITNSGTVNAALTLEPEAVAETPGNGGGRLSSKLELLVIDVTAAGAPVTIYEGAVERMGATNVGSLEPGRSRTYVFVAGLRRQADGDNAYQGAAYSTGFRWTATGVSSPTAAPSETPGGTPTPSPAATPAPPVATPAGDAAADPTGELLGGQLFALPAATRKCVSRRRFAIHVRRPAGMAFRSIAVTVNGRTKVRLKGARARKVKATVNLKGLPAGTVTVKIAAVMSNGRKAVSKRTYKTCAAKTSLKRKR